MEYMQDNNGKPASHMEYVVGRDVAWVKQQAFAFMNQLEGWCSERKADILIDIVLKARPKKILEVGVYGGKSVIPMACALQAIGEGGIIYGIDPWDNIASLQGVTNESNIAYWSTIDLKAILRSLEQKIQQFNLQDQIVLIQNTSENTDPIYDIDILHIDGNHSDVTSYLDVTKWVPYVKQGGTIIFDDMTWYENDTFTTARAVEWLNIHCIKLAEFNDNCIWGIWVKK